MRTLNALFAATILATPAVAGETPWQAVEAGVAIRMVSSGVVSQGKTLVALEFSMPDTTKTYWRVPGQGGLSAELDLSASTGISAHEFRWPYPSRETKSGALGYVYYGDTVLPVELAVDDPSGTLDVVATLGVCSLICIPAQLHFSLPLTDSKPDGPNGLRIKQALAEVPIDWNDDTEPLGSVHLVPGAAAIAVQLDGARVDPESLIAATPNGEPLFGAPQKSPQPDLVMLPILGKTDNMALDGMNVELTFMTDMGAYSVDRVIEASDATALVDHDQ